jgi:hypothetical protein
VLRARQQRAGGAKIRAALLAFLAAPPSGIVGKIDFYGETHTLDIEPVWYEMCTLFVCIRTSSIIMQPLGVSPGFKKKIENRG